MRFSDSAIKDLFGAEAAEDETPERLKSYFFKNKAYDSLTDDLPIRILVGHKGVGKSALLRMAYLESVESSEIALWLKPGEIKKFVASEDHFVEKIRAWRVGLSKIILSKIIEKFSLTKENTVWSNIESSAKSIILHVSRNLSKNYENLNTEELQLIAEKFLKDSRIRVFIDDLDRGWEAKKGDIADISALLNAVRDLCSDDRRLQFCIGLRTDVYYLVRTSDESTDKIETNIINLTWSNHDIFVVFAKRAATYFGHEVTDKMLLNMSQGQLSNYFSDIIDLRFKYKGVWENAPIHKVLLSLIRRRPRDLVKLLTGAAKEANRAESEVITNENLKDTFENYSNERIQDLCLEFRSELPDMEKLLYGMRPKSRKGSQRGQFLFTNDAIIKKIKNIAQGVNFSFTNGRPVTAKALAEFMFKIDFLIARGIDDSERPFWKTFDQNRMLQSQFVDFGFDWEVHPAYRWALQPASVLKIIEDLEMTMD